MQRSGTIGRVGDIAECSDAVPHVADLADKVKVNPRATSRKSILGHPRAIFILDNEPAGEARGLFVIFFANR